MSEVSNRLQLSSLIRKLEYITNERIIGKTNLDSIEYKLNNIAIKLNDQNLINIMKKNYCYENLSLNLNKYIDPTYCIECADNNCECDSKNTSNDNCKNDSDDSDSDTEYESDSDSESEDDSDSECESECEFGDDWGYESECECYYGKCDCCGKCNYCECECNICNDCKKCDCCVINNNCECKCDNDSVPEYESVYEIYSDTDFSDNDNNYTRLIDLVQAILLDDDEEVKRIMRLAPNCFESNIRPEVLKSCKSVKMIKILLDYM